MVEEAKRYDTDNMSLSELFARSIFRPECQKIGLVIEFKQRGRGKIQKPRIRENIGETEGGS